MEKILVISVEVCAILLSALCVYTYFKDYDGMVMFFSIMFAGMAVWCHGIQKSMKFTKCKIWLGE